VAKTVAEKGVPVVVVFRVPRVLFVPDKAEMGFPSSRRRWELRGGRVDEEISVAAAGANERCEFAAL
jgi:hypothetical protein